MKRPLSHGLKIIGLFLWLGSPNWLMAQYPIESVGTFQTFVTTPAVSGYEQELAGEIRATLKDLSPKTDNLGSVYVTLGSGKPHRLIVAPVDEPGYVVSELRRTAICACSACRNGRHTRSLICCTRRSRCG